MQEMPQAQIVGFGSLRVFILCPFPFAACQFFEEVEGGEEDQPTSDIPKATSVALYGMSHDPVMLDGEDAKAFIEWFLTISGERKVQPAGIHLIKR